MPLSVSHSWNSGAWQTQPASRLLSTHQLPPLALDSRSRGLAPALPRTSHLSFLLYLPWERAGRLRPPAMSSDNQPTHSGKGPENPLPGLGQLRTHIMIQVLPFYTRKHQDSDAEDLFLKKKAISGSEVQEGEGLCVPMADSVRVGLWRKLSAEELMLLNCGVGEDSWESLGLQGDPTSPF